MATYSVHILPSVRRDLTALPRLVKRRVGRAIGSLAHEPRPRGAVLLSGSSDERIWRIRVGDYRVLYQVRDKELVVLVIRVAHRREAYRP